MALQVMNRGTQAVTAPARAASAAVLSHWRMQGIGLLRIVFGLVWGIDAWFKWQPDFVNNFTGYLTNAQQQAGQPAIVQNWIGFWINTVKVDPHVFAHGIAVAET
jgi:hypothetical protein